MEFSDPTITPTTNGSDNIDLSMFDANTKKSGLQDFTFIGKKEFSGKAGELRFEKTADKTVLYADINGDRKADFEVEFAKTITVDKSFSCFDGARGTPGNRFPKAPDLTGNALARFICHRHPQEPDCMRR